MTRTVELSVVLPRPAAEVWAHVTTVSGIRDELRPVLRMTTPPGLRGRNVEDLAERLGEPLGRSWLFLLSVLPVEVDDMTVVALEPGRSFHEVSRMASLRRWEHQRVVEARGDSTCEVTDRLTLVGRLRLVEPVAAHVVRLLFAHRHRRLRRWAGAA